VHRKAYHYVITIEGRKINPEPGASEIGWITLDGVVKLSEVATRKGVYDYALANACAIAGLERENPKVLFFSAEPQYFT